MANTNSNGASLKNILKVPEIQKRLLFTFLILVVVRFGAQIPIPGVSRDVFASWFGNQSNGAMDLFDMMTGGSFSQMSVFALSITPYITSSIIMQLMTIIIPSLEEMQKDQDGREKMKEYTFYLSIVLAAIQSLAMGIGFYRGGYLASKNALGLVIVVVALVTGACVLIYLGEEITKHGVGNGVSMILLFNIISRLPQPKTREALESSAREEILRQQDDAIYKRRNFAIEQERSIKENELNTEITIAEKEREKQEKAIDAKMALQQKNAEAKMQQLNDEHEFLMRDVEAHAVSDKALHEKNMESCSFEQKEQEIKNETQRSIADTKAYESDVLLKVFAHIDKDVLTALLLSGMDSGKMIAKAFGDLAANSEKIGNLNITPDLLDTLVKRDGEL